MNPASLRSGFVNLYDDYLRDAGRHGYYWSATTYASPNNAYRLDFGTGVNPSNNYYLSRYFGYYLRCLQE